ncbi:MAG TPA: DNA polymerase/3'-5' exonuclease PolX [Miltoncostaeaceae bacterium]|nr:DNA polymerase/3'-5' exonuclease PolX [Miltoncostaeaceae bacterium]
MEGLPSNGRIAAALDLLGDLLELEGAVRHRVLAYRRGAARVRGASESVARMAQQGRATSLPDIGATLQAKILELAETGTIAALDAARARVPEGLVAVARLEGIGPKRAMALHTHLGVRDTADLRAAVDAGRLAEVPGMGRRTAEALAAQLSGLGPDGVDPEGRVSLGVALPLAEAIAEELRAAPGVIRAEVAGSLRRGRETVHDIDVVAAAEDPAPVFAALEGSLLVERTLSGGDARRTFMTHRGVRVEVAVAPPARFGNLLQHATGSAAHNVRLREMAVRRGWSVSEHGIAREDGDVAMHGDERDVYAELGLRTPPPELREDRGELLPADGDDPWPDLVRVEDLRGEVHVHSTWSDGTVAIAGMAEAAAARGYRYLGIADHSQNLAMAGGLSADRVRRQWEEIDEVNAALGGGIRVLRCTEMDILADGRLDWDDDLLAGFDVVTASLHSGLGRPGPEVTARLLAAIESPHVDVIGHPTGRMLERRGHAAVDVARVAEAAAATGTLLEVNSQPRRLDLDSEMARVALEAGARLVVSSDAHSVDALGYVRYGVLVARRAGARRQDVVNTGPWEGLVCPGAPRR